MQKDYSIYSDFKHFKFIEPFREEEEGTPSLKNSFKAKEGWVVTNPNKAVEFLRSIPENSILHIIYRDGGMIQHFKVGNKEYVFFKKNKFQDNTCLPYSLTRETNEKWVHGTKENTNKGDIVQVVQLKDEPVAPLYGMTGYVTSIEENGRIHGDWGSLAILPDVDNWLVLKGDTDGK